MLTFNDFVLLKAIFNSSLHDAVQSKDKESILKIINSQYIYELENGFIKNHNTVIENGFLMDIDVEYLYTECNERMKDDDLKWAL